MIQIRELFAQAFEAEEIFRVNQAPELPLNYEYTRYPLSRLSDLRDSVRTHATDDKRYSTENDEFLMNYAARFVVTRACEIKFTREGPRTATIPAHSDIASSVLTAGNIHFSEDYSTIVKITNKSGHFCPSFASLVFAVPLLLHSGFSLAERITLVNEATLEEWEFSLDELKELIPDAYEIAPVIAFNNLTTEVSVDTPEPRDRTLAASSMFVPISLSPNSASNAAAASHETESEDGYETPDGAETYFSPAKRTRSNSAN